MIDRSIPHEAETVATVLTRHGDDRDRGDVSLAVVHDASGQTRCPVREHLPGVGQVRVIHVDQVTELVGTQVADRGHAHAMGVTVTYVPLPLEHVSQGTGARLWLDDDAVVKVEVIVDDHPAFEATALFDAVQEGGVILRREAHQVVEVQGLTVVRRDDGTEARAELLQEPVDAVLVVAQNHVAPGGTADAHELVPDALAFIELVLRTNDGAKRLRVTAQAEDVVPVADGDVDVRLEVGGEIEHCPEEPAVVRRDVCIRVDDESGAIRKVDRQDTRIRQVALQGTEFARGHRSQHSVPDLEFTVHGIAPSLCESWAG